MERYVVTRRSKHKADGFLTKCRRKYSVLRKRSWITSGFDLNFSGAGLLEYPVPFTGVERDHWGFSELKDVFGQLCSIDLQIQGGQLNKEPESCGETLDTVPKIKGLFKAEDRKLFPEDPLKSTSVDVTLPALPALSLFFIH
uniref:SFRICE_006686 n=1 Tax=Spodoptera frugiperda TaxID=7108 RepID=A0A2H1WIH5_SPOFR